MIEQFKKDVAAGLSAEPKTLPSKYFYDAKGDALFVQIMHLPEYYLTRAEHEIFREKTGEIIAQLGVQKDVHFELIELGAGDGTKTKELLYKLSADGFSFDYLPIDISQHALDGLQKNLSEELPAVCCTPKQGDYFEVLESLKNSTHAKVVLFLGSNIGNLSDECAAEFMCELGNVLNPGDILFLGVDLIKDQSIVLPAYNDSAGITRAFNLNLLERMNRELDANFNLEQFEHAPEYTAESGVAKSFLMSTVDQTVTISAIDSSFDFKKGEKIHTEVSRKYNDAIIAKITQDSPFSISGKLSDTKEYFTDYVLRRS